MKSRTSSKFGHIRLTAPELAALERLEALERLKKTNKRLIMGKCCDLLHI